MNKPSENKVISLDQALQLESISDAQQEPVVLGLIRYIHERTHANKEVSGDVLSAYKSSLEVAESQEFLVSKIIGEIAEKILLLCDKGLSREILFQGLDIGTLIKDLLRLQAQVLAKTEAKISCRVSIPSIYEVQQNGRTIRTLIISQDCIYQGKVAVAKHIISVFKQLQTEGFTNCTLQEPSSLNELDQAA